MRCVQPYRYSSLLGIAFLFLLCAAPAHGQGNSKPAEEEAADVKALLREVRLLRQTIQIAALNSYRSQIIIERIRTSNEQVLRMTQALTELRQTMEKTESTIPRMTEQHKVLETTLEAEVDLAKRARLEMEIKEMKRSVERYKAGLEKMKEQEQQQSLQLREQQTRVSDLENRLDQLEAEIERDIRQQRSDDRVGDSRKQ